jgi:hypothetical protein
VSPVWIFGWDCWKALSGCCSPGLSPGKPFPTRPLVPEQFIPKLLAARPFAPKLLVVGVSAVPRSLLVRSFCGRRVNTSVITWKLGGCTHHVSSAVRSTGAIGTFEDIAAFVAIVDVFADTVASIKEVGRATSAWGA